MGNGQNGRIQSRLRCDGGVCEFPSACTLRSLAPTPACAPFVQEERSYTADELETLALEASRKDNNFAKTVREKLNFHIKSKKSSQGPRWTPQEEERVMQFCREKGKTPSETNKKGNPVSDELAKTFKPLESELGRTYEAIRGRW